MEGLVIVGEGIGFMQWCEVGLTSVGTGGGSPVQGVLDGKYDDLPEQAFYMVGGIEEVSQKAEKLAKDMA